MNRPGESWLEEEILRARGETNYSARIRRTLFAQQLALLDDHAHPIRTACCSRRAGKTQGIMRGLIMKCLERPNSICVYFVDTIARAKKLVWLGPGTIPDIIDSLGLRAICETNESDHYVRFRNGSILWVTGCETLQDAKYWKGKPYDLAVIDEAQDWRAEILEYMVDTVLVPALMDHDGEVILAGVPGPMLDGLFYRASTGVYPGWPCHYWTYFDNPFIKNKDTFLAKHLKDKNLPINDAGIQREFFGKWVRDSVSQLFHYEPGRNDYVELPNGRNWQHVLGLDFGSRDFTTFVLQGYRMYDPCVYGIAAYGEQMAGKAGVSRILEIIASFQERFGQDIEIVADTGALGLMIADELRHRPPGVAVIPAKKTEKASAIRLMNDQLRLGLVRYGPDCGALTDQLLKLQIDPKTQIEKTGQACDFADAALYGWRHTYAFMADKEPDRSPSGLQKDLVASIIARRQREIAEAKDDGYAERRSMRIEEY